MKRPGGFDGPASEPVPRAQKRAPKDPLVLPSTKPEFPAESSVETSAVGERVTPLLPIAQVIPEQTVSQLSPSNANDSGEEFDRVRRAKEKLRRAERRRKVRERREKKRFTEHARARRRRLAIVGAAILGLAAFVAAGVFTPLMAVRDIQLEGAVTVNSEELTTALKRFEGVPLALVSDADIHRVLEPFPLIQRYAIERVPPHTLIVRVEERTAVVALERDGGFDLLDPAGVLLNRVPERPVGVPVGSPELTDTSSKAFLAAASVVRDLPADLREQLVAVRASNGQDVSFVLASGTEVVWGEPTGTQQKAIVLRSMLAAIGNPAMIDVSAPEAPVFK